MPRRARWLLAILVGVAVVAAAIGTLSTLGQESTDDAQIEGHVTNVSSRIAGQIIRVPVKDNEMVKAGQLLAEIDDRDWSAKVSAAQADLDAAEASLEGAEKQLTVLEKTVDSNLKQAKGTLVQADAMQAATQASIRQAQADLEVAESKRALAELDLQRSTKLFRDNAVAASELDNRKAQYEQAVALVAQAEARLRSAEVGITNTQGNLQTAHGRMMGALSGPAQLEAARAQVGMARAKVGQAKAALQQAELNQSFTKIFAPVAGAVTRRSVEVGQMVFPDRPLLALVSREALWTVANFKEDQLANIRVGQPAGVRVDTYGRRSFAAHVESIASGTGARFSLLPPDNASGNFTKVVQRVPVLIRFDTPPDVELRPGMSASVTVTTSPREES